MIFFRIPIKLRFKKTPSNRIVHLQLRSALAVIVNPEQKIVSLLSNALPSSLLLQIRGTATVPSMEVEQGGQKVPVPRRQTLQRSVRFETENVALRPEFGVSHDGGGYRTSLVSVFTEN